MGMKWDEGEWNPMRPKRLRHLFRTACDTAGVSELHINAFMGHANGMGQSYSELSTAKLELEYLRVEPYLTVYGAAEEASEVKEKISRLEGTIATLSEELTKLKEWKDHFTRDVGWTPEERDIVYANIRREILAMHEKEFRASDAERDREDRNRT
jgi:integrase